jgi:alcohol dehydrogenase class IV
MSVILDNYTQIEKVFEQLNVQRPFICCGKSFQKTKIFDYLKQFDIVVFDNIRPNPRFDDMIDAAKLFNEQGCDFMIGAGGGSPMDSAKMIRLMTTNDISKCLDEPMKNNDIKALFIPTTAGTGSEATKTSVFYLNEVDKTSIANYDFIPDYVLFDESLLETLPDYQRKCTCLDALCHAIESYISVNANDESKEYATKAIKLFFENKDSYMRNEPEGNRGMLMASYYGGKAINLTGTTAAHAMCYNITMNCGTAHGHSVAIGLAEIWKYMLEHNEKVNDKRGRDYVLNTFSQLDDMMGGNGLETFKQLLNEFKLDNPTVDESQIPIFASKVIVSRLGKNPTTLDENDVEEIYKRILLGD